MLTGEKRGVLHITLRRISSCHPCLGREREPKLCPLAKQRFFFCANAAGRLSECLSKLRACVRACVPANAAAAVAAVSAAVGAGIQDWR